MAIKLHILNANGKLSKMIDYIQQSFAVAVEQINEVMILESLSVDVIAKYNEYVPPEMGMGGYTPTEHEIQLWLPEDNDYLMANFQQLFTATLAHELHHCFRHGSVGYGKTLLEALITEGLACHFESMVVNKTPIYVDHLDNKDRQSWLEKSRQLWHSTDYSHADWFFGNDKKGIPKWVGYDLGFALVNQYLQKVGSNAVDSYDTPAIEFVSV
ncbi:DUF2268 domain-containing putative Zn-dependent protease [Psychrobacter sp. I-STPA10]|uniref:DUF2268 domain-containing putative Zn-dependent protease n=1 Tax=Psychrobacter sp. I-STPA10 TaxID=2585769 RepID=UPI001E590B72|nr:DUF2268 domain-containing putative Zn-dependent protease [Psychrobacter sp. I-STPA10]